MSADIAPLVMMAALGQDVNLPPVPGAKATESAPIVPSQGSPAPGTGQQPQSSPFGGGMLWILLGAMVLIVVMSSMSGRKQEKQRRAMLSTLKRSDRVQTLGGIIGTVVDLTDQEMTLRVDEASNTKIRFARSAVQQIIREAKESPRGDLEPKPSAEAAAAT